jgi:hypothetical protein
LLLLGAKRLEHELQAAQIRHCGNRSRPAHARHNGGVLPRATQGREAAHPRRRGAGPRIVAAVAARGIESEALRVARARRVVRPRPPVCVAEPQRQAREGSSQGDARGCAPRGLQGRIVWVRRLRGEEVGKNVSGWRRGAGSGYQARVERVRERRHCAATTARRLVLARRDVRAVVAASGVPAHVVAVQVAVQAAGALEGGLQHGDVEALDECELPGVQLVELHAQVAARLHVVCDVRVERERRSPGLEIDGAACAQERHGNVAGGMVGELDADFKGVALQGSFCVVGFAFPEGVLEDEVAKFFGQESEEGAEDLGPDRFVLHVPCQRLDTAAVIATW